MELVLERLDLSQVSSISHRNTMQLLPVGKKKKQKIVIGDDSGNVECFEMKKGESQPVFKTQVEGTGINVLSLGGSLSKRDKVFVATGQTIVGINKKGKQFFKLISSLTETIHHMYVEDTKMWTGCEYIYNKYDDGNDAGFFMCHDRINALAVESLTRETEYDALLGCQDRCIRVVQGSNLEFEGQLDAPVTALRRYIKSASAARPAFGGPKEMVYGTENGQLGMLLMHEHFAQRQWVVPNPTRQGQVNCISSIDVTKDDVADIIVGRDDGRVQVFSFDMAPTPGLQFERVLGESIHSLDCGIVTTPPFDELVVCTYSGKVISYSSEPLNVKDQRDQYGRTVGEMHTENRIRTMRKELETLRGQVTKQREKFTQLSKQFIPVAQQFEVNTKFNLDPEEAAYMIHIELPMPIDLVALSSSVHVDLLDSETNSNAVVSRSPADSTNKNALLATYRCQETSNRVEMKIRTTEGESGDITATVVAKTNPKVAQVIKLQVKSLSLHHRIHALEEDESARKLNVLKMTGTFSQQTMHDWISGCLPEVPPRLQQESVSLIFRNVFTGSVLTCEYRKGEATISSDSITTIAILKEHISEGAVRLRINISDTFQIQDESIPAFLGLIHPKLEHQLALAQQVELIDAVKEIQQQESDARWMSSHYAEIVANADRIRAEFKERPRALQYLSGIVTDLFVDRYKFKGADVKHKIPELQQLLCNYNFDALVAFFNARH